MPAVCSIWWPKCSIVFWNTMRKLYHILLTRWSWRYRNELLSNISFNLHKCFWHFLNKSFINRPLSYIFYAMPGEDRHCTWYIILCDTTNASPSICALSRSDQHMFYFIFLSPFFHLTKALAWNVSINLFSMLLYTSLIYFSLLGGSIPFFDMEVNSGIFPLAWMNF